MTTIITIVQHTPIWVFPLIALLLWLGAINLRTREVSLWSLFVFPVVMLALSAGNAVGTIASPDLALMAWLGGAAAGTAIGGSITSRPVAIDSPRRKLTVAGSVVPLLVFVALMTLRYYFGYLYGRHPELKTNSNYALMLIGAGALLGGVMLGRYARLGLCYWRHAAALARLKSAKFSEPI